MCSAQLEKFLPDLDREPINIEEVKRSILKGKRCPSILLYRVETFFQNDPLLQRRSINLSNCSNPPLSPSRDLTSPLKIKLPNPMFKPSKDSSSRSSREGFRTSSSSAYSSNSSSGIDSGSKILHSRKLHCFVKQAELQRSAGRPQGHSRPPQGSKGGRVQSQLGRSQGSPERQQQQQQSLRSHQAFPGIAAAAALSMATKAAPSRSPPGSSGQRDKSPPQEGDKDKKQSTSSLLDTLMKEIIVQEEKIKQDEEEAAAGMVKAGGGGLVEDEIDNGCYVEAIVETETDQDMEEPPMVKEDESEAVDNDGPVIESLFSLRDSPDASNLFEVAAADEKESSFNNDQQLLQDPLQTNETQQSLEDNGSQQQQPEGRDTPSSFKSRSPSPPTTPGSSTSDGSGGSKLKDPLARSKSKTSKSDPASKIERKRRKSKLNPCCFMIDLKTEGKKGKRVRTNVIRC